MQGLLIYISAFLLSTFFMKLAEKSEENKIYRNFFLIISLGIPIIISALRYNVGTDYKNYISLYNKYATIPIKNSFSVKQIEIFFIIVCKIAYIFKNANVMFFIYSFLTILFMFLYMWDNKQKNSIALMWILYLFLYFPSSMNIVRQALSVAIVTYSYKYIEKRKFIKFLIFVAFAIIVHKTAIVILPLYILLNFKTVKNKKIFYGMRIIALIMSFIIMVNIENIIISMDKIEGLDKYGGYKNYFEDINNYSFILKIIIFLFITVFIKYMTKR